MEKAIRFELRSGCQELNAKTQGRKAAKKSLLKRSGSPAEIRLFALTKCSPNITNLSHRARPRNAAPPRPLAGAGGWGVRVVTARKAVWLFAFLHAAAR